MVTKFAPHEVGQAEAVISRCRDLRISLADASIVVLSNRYGCRRVLTLDQRHFRVLQAAGSTPFDILPADNR